MLNNNIKYSLSRKSCPYNNPVCENIYKTIKIKFVCNWQFESLVQLEIELAEYWMGNQNLDTISMV